jgi:hypothetical protein
VTISLDNNPISWSNEEYNKIVETNIVVGYLLAVKQKANTEDMSLNLYLLPLNGLEPSIKLTHADLKSAFLQWLETLVISPRSFQFRNPPLDLWLETRLNWINALCVKIHQKYGTDISEALSTAYMTILTLYKKGSVYIGNLHYLEIAIYTAIKKEHYYMRNRLSGEHPNAIHLDASPGDFNLNIDNDVTNFHEIIAAPTWATEEEKRYDEIWDKMKADMLHDFSEREIEQICKAVQNEKVDASIYLPSALYRRLLAWRKSHDLDDYL